MNFLDQLGRIVKGEAVSKVVDDLITSLPWVDMLTASAIAHLRRVLSENSVDRRKELMKSLLTGLCSSCLFDTNQCRCRKEKALRKTR